MRLINDAAKIARRAWSMRLIYASVILGAVDVALPFFAPEQPSRAFGVLSVLVGIGAGVARVVSQPRLHGEA
jgi:hypothetical protein